MNRLDDLARAPAALLASHASQFQDFVRAARFPCVGAKSALNRDRMEFGLFDELTNLDDATALCEQLADFSARHPDPGVDPVSFVAMFRQPVVDEDEFHRQLWRHLQAMHDLDAAAHAWDPTVSSNVDDAQFSFSIASRAFFVVGLHPHASRLARRAPFACLVFNFHNQFEAMRETGKYQRLQDAIRTRDIALQGDINPILARFGDASEAAQYSGHARAAAAGCPFHARAA